MILGYDTETTDLINDKAPPSHPSQPYLVQLGLILKDYAGVERARVALIVQPDQGPNGVIVTSGLKALEAHGITPEIAAACGVPNRVAVAVLTNLARRATHRVAHNQDFDIVVAQAAMIRAGVPPDVQAIFLNLIPVCTMRTASPITNIPPTPRMVKQGFTKNKPPSVRECCKFFFDREPTKAHDALGDVSDCLDIYFELVKRGALPDLGAAIAA